MCPKKVILFLIELALSGLDKKLVLPKGLEYTYKSFLFWSLVLLNTMMLSRYIITHLPKRGLKILFIRVTKVDGA